MRERESKMQRKLGKIAERLKHGSVVAHFATGVEQQCCNGSRAASRAPVIGDERRTWKQVAPAEWRRGLSYRTGREAGSPSRHCWPALTSVKPQTRTTQKSKVIKST